MSQINDDLLQAWATRKTDIFIVYSELTSIRNQIDKYPDDIPVPRAAVRNIINKAITVLEGTEEIAGDLIDNIETNRHFWRSLSDEFYADLESA